MTPDETDDWIHITDEIPGDNEIVRCKYLSKEFDGYVEISCLEILGRQAPVIKWYNRDGDQVPVGFWRRDISMKVSRYDLLDLDD